MKTPYALFLNAAVAAVVAYFVTAIAQPRLPETIKCRRLVAAESVESRQVITGYVSVGVPGLYGRQGSVTINAGRDWAGINVTDGEATDSLWVESRAVK